MTFLFLQSKSERLGKKCSILRSVFTTNLNLKHPLTVAHWAHLFRASYFVALFQITSYSTRIIVKLHGSKSKQLDFQNNLTSRFAQLTLYLNSFNKIYLSQEGTWSNTMCSFILQKFTKSFVPVYASSTCLCVWASAWSFSKVKPHYRICWKKPNELKMRSPESIFGCLVKFLACCYTQHISFKSWSFTKQQSKNAWGHQKSGLYFAITK